MGRNMLSSKVTSFGLVFIEDGNYWFIIGVFIYILFYEYGRLMLDFKLYYGFRFVKEVISTSTA